MLLRERKIFTIPDFLANAGGVTCSYFEQVQSNQNYFWEKDDVLGRLDVKMTSAFVAVSELARKKNLRNARCGVRHRGRSRRQSVQGKRLGVAAAPSGGGESE